MATSVEPGFRMHAETTPNPNSVKWVLGRLVTDPGVSAHFEAPPSDEVSTLAARLFEVEGVEIVYLASNFVTVTKREGVAWLDIADPIAARLKECLAEGQPALGPAFEAGPVLAGGDLEERIRGVLDREIRPQVAMDGGDVVFSGFRDGVVELRLQGSCSGCPASAATLKHGIEARLKEAVPEVREVVALEG